MKHHKNNQIDLKKTKDNVFIGGKNIIAELKFNRVSESK